MVAISAASLRPVEFSDRAFLRQALVSHTDLQSCECAEANLFLWRDAYGEVFTPVDGRFWVLEKSSRMPHYPIGKPFSPRELYDLAKLAETWGFKPEFYDVPESYPAADGVRDFFDVICDEESRDYLYDLEQQSALTGPLLRKKRNLVRQFERNNPGWRLEAVRENNLSEVVNLAGTLNSRLKDCDFLDKESLAMAALPEYFGKLDMGGVILYAAGGVPAGFSIFSRMADGVTFDIHFEKADHEIKGAPQKLTSALAGHLLHLGGKFMNREQDMGEPGLVRAKKSLDPCAMVSRVLLTAKREVTP